MHTTEKFMLSAAILTGTIAGFSCAGKQPQSLFSGKTAVRPILSPDRAGKTYLIQPNDLLQIRNLQNRKYIVHEPVAVKTQTAGSEGQIYEVEADSTIALPVLGRIKIAGLSRSEASRHLELLYRKELKDPIIELKVLNLKVTILGEVRLQGTYNLVKDHTLLTEVIGAAGGLTDKANSKNIKIIRRDPQAGQVVELDLTDIQTLSDPASMLQNNDIIYVSQNKKAIRSEKLQSIAAILQPLLSLLNTAWIIHTLTRR